MATPSIVGRLRAAALVVFVTGTSICTFSDRPASAGPPRIDAYYVLAADFHVHTAFGDGGLAPWDARREARRRGIDVIAITNHNHLLAARVYRRWFHSSDPPLVLTGQEVTAPHHHILAIGISSLIDWDQSAESTIAAIHAQGGVAIAAHPTADSALDFGAEALTRLDAAERAHPGMRQERDDRTNKASEYEAFFARARAYNPRISPVGDSDFHFTGEIGLCRTYLLAREISEEGVLDALRNGRTVAYDFDGRAYGDPGLIDVAEQARRVRAASAAPPSRVYLNGVGAVLVWIGAAGLVLLGPGVASRASRK